MENFEATYNADRSRAVLFGALAKFVVWSQGRAPQDLLEEAERAMAHAGALDGPVELARAL